VAAERAAAACSGPRAAATTVTAGVTAAAAARKWLEGLINHPAVVGCDDVALSINGPMALYWENQCQQKGRNIVAAPKRWWTS
jgi:hypothetical protein